MKYSALASLLLVASAIAFSPASSNGRVDTLLSAKKGAVEEKKSVASRIFELDLFAPVADQNDYGARKKKKIVTGKLTDNSYVPAGLTKAQYAKIRQDEKAKKESNYKAKMAKAGIFEDFTECKLVSLPSAYMLCHYLGFEQLALTRPFSHNMHLTFLFFHRVQEAWNRR